MRGGRNVELLAERREAGPRRRRAGLVFHVKFLQGVAHARPAGKRHVRHVARGFGQGDAQVKKLEMGGQRPRGGECRGKHDTVDCAAAPRDHDFFHVPPPRFVIARQVVPEQSGGSTPS